MITQTIASATGHELRKWRRMLLIRDCEEVQGQRLPRCVMCGGVFPVVSLQAHHIKPKSLYPLDALKLSNGVILCVSCHMGIVHRGNSFKDTADPSNPNAGWLFFKPAFEEYVESIYDPLD